MMGGEHGVGHDQFCVMSVVDLLLWWLGREVQRWTQILPAHVVGYWGNTGVFGMVVWHLSGSKPVRRRSVWRSSGHVSASRVSPGICVQRNVAVCGTHHCVLGGTRSKFVCARSNSLK